MPAPNTRPAWLTYEQAACKVLQDIRDNFKITQVEGKQDMQGQSGTTWELDAKAWIEDGNRFLVVEVRRYPSSRLKQKDVAALAWSIQDVGAAGGIAVSPLPLQSGATLVAKAAGIEHVLLTPESTSASYLAEYMGKRFHGASVSESLGLSDRSDAVVIRNKSDA